MTPKKQTEYTQKQIQLKQQQINDETYEKHHQNSQYNKNMTQQKTQQTTNEPNKKQLKRTQQHNDERKMNTPTKRIKLIPNEKPQQSPKNNNKQKTQETTKQNKKLVLTQQKKTQKQRKPIKNIQYNNIPEQEPIPDTTKMNTAEIIQNTYVEYLPDGTKRDRYRKEFLKNNN